jgi:LacI family gluconate utilization system Gnt-I transcriptional repressor
MAQGAGLLAMLRARREQPDAVFCVGAPIAIGIVLAARRLGVAIPGQLAVAAFGDSELAGLVTPALTAVSIPRFELGRTAGEMLLRRFAGQQPEKALVDLGFTLIVRETT